MLVGMELNKSPLDLMLDSMHRSTILLYPTGSRWIGGATQASDWDFMISADHLQQFCREFSDFRTMAVNIFGYEYKDKSVLSVLRHKNLPIDIQVIDPNYIAKKVEVTNWLKENYKRVYSLSDDLRDKMKRKSIWNMLLSK